MTHVKPRTSAVTIYQGDDLETLADRVWPPRSSAAGTNPPSASVPRRARPSTAKSEARAGDDEIVGTFEVCTDAQDAYDAFVDEAAERAVTVRVRLIGRSRFR